METRIPEKNKSIDKILYLLVIAGVILAISIPAFRSGIYNGFDLWFHLGRIESISRELANGQFPVRYETLSWYGNGYVSSIMYGNIFLYIPALLHILGVETYRCYNIYVIIVNAIGTGICLYSFKGLFKNKYWFLISTVMYMMAGYYISNVYMRAAVGEYTATIFIPLVVYGIYRIYFENSEASSIKKVLPLVIGVTGIIQSHVLTTLMIAMAVLVFIIVYLKDTINNIKPLLLALLLVLAINAFFLIPFIDSYTSYVFNASVETVGVNIQKNGLYLSQILGLFPEAKGARVDWSSEGKEYLRIGMLHVISLFMMILLIAFKKKFIVNDEQKKSFRLACTVFGIGAIAAWMSTAYFPWSVFAGDNAISNIMRSVQYPSRYLVIQTVCWNICGVYALKIFSEQISLAKNKIFKTCVLLAVLFVALLQTGIFMYTLSCYNRTIQTVEGHDAIADGLYLKYGTDTEKLASEAILLTGEATVEDLGYNGRWREINIVNSSEDEATILVPIFDYKYIHAYDSNNRELTLESTENNQYSITVAEGFSDKIRVGFVEPTLWRISEMISLITIIFLGVKWILIKKSYT
ncbi:hypothetical protein SAMN04487831_103266 [Pseudobutyrivibrio sp. UC1225]|uniref:hypothetical protein n=1 Tax=Pseudobutyrivibrio sp. UC1225 TaxID=1798185 RepID=UPI0008E6D139|nr:hypothetical protein [Pseudobutyrivibrio sp. UC1225]SFN78088.1 hypothetical protein SAMN04487831_103266 [Pseudobutyrivibrio sp. UC1225]